MLKAQHLESTEEETKIDVAPHEIQTQPTKPLFVFPLLAAGIVAVSSAAVAFSSMSEISPCLLAFWRTQFTAIILMPSGVYSIWKLTAEEKQKMMRQAHLILASGTLMGCHFGTWVLCIENTSLPHALLTSTTAPIIIAVGSWLLRKPISLGELIGTGIAAIGVLLISRSAGTEKQVSLFGDAMGLISSIFYVLYLSIGRTLRTWLPIFAYVFPLFTLGTLTLCLAALITEGAKFDTSTSGLFGQYSSWHYLWRTLYLGAVPGIVGHVSFNALLKWINPLIIALAGTTEPLIGTAIGLMVGIGALPGLFTYLGGTVLIASTVTVIMASHKREKREAEDSLSKDQATVGLVPLPNLDLGLDEDAGQNSIHRDELNVEEEALLKKGEEVPLEKLV